MNRKVLWTAAAFFMMMAVLAGCSVTGGGGPCKPNALMLTVMHVNDTHSHLEPSYEQPVNFDGTATYLDMGGFARLTAKVRQVRSEKKNTLLLHAGDVVQGTLYFTKYEGKPETAFLNRLRFDAMTLGNHEFDNGPVEAARLLSMVKFPVISANIDASAEADLERLISSYIIKAFGGEKVGIVGLSPEDTGVISSPGDDVKFKSAVETAVSVVSELKGQDVNKIIFLTHLGYKNDIALAKAVDGIDLIVGGHSHTLLGSFSDLGMNAEGAYPTKVAGPAGDPVYLVQDWEWAKALGIVNIKFDAAGIITSISGTPVLLVGGTFRQKDADGNKVIVSDDVKTGILKLIAANPSIEVVAEDADAAAMLAPYKTGVEEFGNVKIGTAGQDLLHIREPGTHTSGGELPGGSSIAPHVCEAMVWKANSVGLDVDMSILNAGGVRIDIPAGDITVGDVYALMPFGNTLMVLEVTGTEIKNALQAGLTRGEGAFPYVGNARYTADATNADAVTLISVDIKQADGSWKAVEDAATYRIAASDYLADGGDGYEVLKNTPGYRYDTGFVDAEIFVDYVKRKGTLDRPADAVSLIKPAVRAAPSP